MKKKEAIGLTAISLALLIMLGGCSKETKNQLIGGSVATSSGSTATSGVAKALASLGTQSGLSGTSTGSASSGGGALAFQGAPGAGISRAQQQGCTPPFSSATKTGANSTVTGTPFWNISLGAEAPGDMGSMTPSMAGSATSGGTTIDMFDPSGFCDDTAGFSAFFKNAAASRSSSITIAMKNEIKGGGTTASGETMTMGGKMEMSQTITFNLPPLPQPPTVSGMTFSVTAMTFSGTHTTKDGKTISFTFTANVPFTPPAMSKGERGKDMQPSGTATVTISPDNITITGTKNSSGFTGTVTDKDGKTLGTVVVDSSGIGTFTGTDGTVKTFKTGFI